MASDSSMLPLRSLLRKSDEQINIQPDEQYKQITVKMWGKGVELRDIVDGITVSSSQRNVAREKQLIISRIDARHGAIGLVPLELDGAIVTNDFPLFNINTQILLPEYLNWLTTTQDFIQLCMNASEGTTNRVRLKIEGFLGIVIQVPPLEEQRRIVAYIDNLAQRIQEAQGLRRGVLEETERLFDITRDRIFRELECERKKIGDLFNLVNGKAFKPSEWSNRGLPIVRIQNLKYPNAEYNYYEKPVDEKFYLRNGDVLFAWSGQVVSFGAHVWEGGQAILNQHIWRIEPKTLNMLPAFVCAGFNTLIDEMKSQVRGLEMFHIRKQEVDKMVFPVVSLEEQRQIISYLADFQTYIDSLRKLQIKSQIELNALLPSILDREFKGELF